MQLVPWRYELHIPTREPKFGLSDSARVGLFQPLFPPQCLKERVRQTSLSRNSVTRRLTSGCWGQKWGVRVHALLSHWWQQSRSDQSVGLNQAAEPRSSIGSLLESGFLFQTQDFSNTASRLAEEQARGRRACFLWPRWMLASLLIWSSASAAASTVHFQNIYPGRKIHSPKVTVQLPVDSIQIPLCRRPINCLKNCQNMFF